MSVSEKVKCIDGNDKKLSISRHCELLQLPRSSYYRPRYYQVEDEENLELMSQTSPEIDVIDGLGVNSSQTKHQQATQRT